MRSALAVLFCSLCGLLIAGPSAAAEIAAQRIIGAHHNGAAWVIEMPGAWNGTVLLYAHGYSPALSTAPPESAPREAREWLLSRGYALAASAYTAGGWALAEAPTDQLQVLDEFVQRFGQPRRTIAWGSSMGGLVTLALAERQPQRIQGALSMCGSVSGSLGMLNTALDGAFAFRTLLAPDSPIRIVDVDDDRANAARVQTILQSAWTTPTGRARVMLAAALAQLPAWSDVTQPQPPPKDFDAQAEQLRRTFALGVFVPRVDQEHRAGGVYGWNTGVNYRQLLAKSPLASLVRHMYSQAQLNLDTDLATLNAAPRIAARPDAVAYMRANFVPRGDWQVPVLTLQTIGDGLTVPATHGGLTTLTRAAGGQRMLGQLWIKRAGHCSFSTAEMVAALLTLEQRLASGHWSLTPKAVATRGASAPGMTQFIRYRAPSLPRQCGARVGSCVGEPAPAAGARP